MAPKLPDPEDIGRNKKSLNDPFEAALNKKWEPREGDAGPQEGEGPEWLSDRGEGTSAPSGGGSSPSLKRQVAEQALRGNPEAAETLDKVDRARVAMERTSAAAGHVAKAGSALLAVVTNPITWITVIVLAMVLVVVSTFQVVGQNENADGCVSGNGMVVGEIALEADGRANIASAHSVLGSWLMTTNFDFLGGKPMTKEQAASLIGNMRHESYLTPTTSESGWASPTASNDEILAVGAVRLKAVGLVQWDSDRRVAMVNYAKSKGRLWSDIVMQLEYLKTELESSYESKRLLDRGFADPGKSVDELTKIFHDAFERSGAPAMDRRIAYANEFYTSYSGSGTATGGSCLGGSFDASDLVNLAVSIAYPHSQFSASRVPPYDRTGQSNAPAAYKEAKKAAMQVGGADGYLGGNLLASCDRFVATVIKLSLDPDLPWGPTAQQLSYLNNSPKWQKYMTKGNEKPGDIWITNQTYAAGGGGGHIILYIGMVQGVDSIAHASYMSRVGAIEPATYLGNDLRDRRGKQYAGFQFIGQAPGSPSLPYSTTP